MAVIAGLIGSGFMGKTHALALANVNRIFDLPLAVQLHTFGDIDVQTARKAARQLGFAHATGDWRDLISNPDINLIDITTPTASIRKWLWRPSRPESMSIVKSRWRPLPPIAWK